MKTKYSKAILKRIKYKRGEGYKVVEKDGSLSVWTFKYKAGAVHYINGYDPMYTIPNQ